MYMYLSNSLFQVLVWASISRKGPTNIVIFKGIMDSSFYQEILQDNLIPFIKENYPDGHRLMQDNDPKHTSASTKEWMSKAGINWWHTPPESPDRNSIDNDWHSLKCYL